MKNSKELEGCVFYFFDEFENNIKKQKKYKIVTLDFFMENELTNQKIISKIDENKMHYYLCKNNKELTITEFDENPINIKGKNIKKDDTILLEYDIQELIYLKKYLKNATHPSKYILLIINFYKHLLKSLHLLVNTHIFHNHINFDSIVVDKFEYPLLTNFSFSINLSSKYISQNMKRFIIAYEPDYVEWSIELHILSYLLTNKLESLSNYNIETIIEDVINNNAILKIFGDSLVSSYKVEALQYFKKYVNQSYEYILEDILQFSNTWDNYALSILFLRILIDIHNSVKCKNKFIIQFMKLLVCNIHTNPFKRLSIELTIRQFDALLDILEPKDYKDVINCLMSA
jgi:hypothetical protein